MLEKITQNTGFFVAKYTLLNPLLSFNLTQIPFQTCVGVQNIPLPYQIETCIIMKVYVCWHIVSKWEASPMCLTNHKHTIPIGCCFKRLTYVIFLCQFHVWVNLLTKN